MKRAVIRIKPGVLQQLMDIHNTNLTGLVGVLGVSYTQLYRVEKEYSGVGSKIIAGILAAHPDKKFEDFFYVKTLTHMKERW